MQAWMAAMLHRRSYNPAHLVARRVASDRSKASRIRRCDTSVARRAGAGVDYVQLVNLQELGAGLRRAALRVDLPELPDRCPEGAIRIRSMASVSEATRVSSSPRAPTRRPPQTLIINLVVDPIRADLGLTDVQISLLQGVGFALVYAIVASGRDEDATALGVPSSQAR